MVDAETKQLRTKCLQACLEGELEQVKNLLAKGVEINGEVDGWSSLLSASVHECQSNVAQHLLENGAALIHDTSQLGAVNNGDAELLRLLLEHGADRNWYSPETGETFLHIAACRGQHPGTTECVRLLLKAGADPNVQTKNRVGTPTYGGAYVVRETPLHLAAAYGDLEMIRLLIDAGADPLVKDADGHMPRFYFARYSVAAHRGQIKDLLPYHEPAEGE